MRLTFPANSGSKAGRMYCLSPRMRRLYHCRVGEVAEDRCSGCELMVSVVRSSFEGWFILPELLFISEDSLNLCSVLPCHTNSEMSHYSLFSHMQTISHLLA